MIKAGEVWGKKYLPETWQFVTKVHDGRIESQEFGDSSMQYHSVNEFIKYEYVKIGEYNHELQFEANFPK